jgi:hypothetical protein
VTGRRRPRTLPEWRLAVEPAALASRAPRERGQATVELAALLPLLAVVALAAYAMLAGLAAGEQAGVAAEAGAIALLQDRDPAAAARGALPHDARATVQVEARRVAVAVRPRVPLVAGLLRTRVVAHAGPEPSP